MLSPEEADRQTTATAHAVVEQATRPAPAFTPPPVSAWEAPSQGAATTGGFTPPPVSAWEGGPPTPAGSSPLREQLKGEGFWDSAWQSLKSPFSFVQSLLGGDVKTENIAENKQFQQLQKNGTPEQRREFAKDYLLKHIPFASTGYKAVQGNLAGAAGDIAGMLPYAAMGKAPEIARTVGDSAFGAGAKGFATGAAKAAASPKTLMGAGGAELLGNSLNIPHAGAIVEGARAIYGGVKGARAALDARVARASALAAKATAEAAKAAPIPKALLGTGDIIPPAPADTSFVRSVPAEYPPPRQLGPGPTITPPPPDASFVRSVPAEYPAVERPPVGSAAPQAAPPPPEAPATPTRLSLPQAEAAMARKTPATPESPRSQFDSAGERKSPQLRAEEIKAMNRIAKTGRFVDAMQGGGLRVADVMRMDEGHWQTLADGLGEKIPSPETRAEILKALRKSQPPASSPARPAAAPAEPVFNPQPGSSLTPRSMGLAQQLLDEMRRSGTYQ